MKTIASLFAVTVLLASAANAMADQQRSDEAPGYALGLQVSRGSTLQGAPYAAAHRGSYAPYWRARSGGARASVPLVYDFGNDPRIINLQAQGSH